MAWFRQKQAPPRPQGPTPGTVAALDAANRELVRWLRSQGGQLPGRAMEFCRLISDHLDDVVRDPASASFDVQTLVVLERTASAHVPDTVRAYLSARHVEGAEDMLMDQLGTLERVTRSSVGRSQEGARDALAVQGTFLEEKFGNV